MKKVRIIVPILVMIIIVVGFAARKLKITDLFSSGDEFYSDIYEAYESSENVNIDDSDKISTFDFENHAIIIYYFDDESIMISYMIKENDMYRYSGKRILIEEKYISKEFVGEKFSYKDDSITWDIVSSNAKIPDGYMSQDIELKDQTAKFVYKLC